MRFTSRSLHATQTARLSHNKWPECGRKKSIYDKMHPKLTLVSRSWKKKRTQNSKTSIFWTCRSAIVTTLTSLLKLMATKANKCYVCVYFCCCCCCCCDLRLWARSFWGGTKRVWGEWRYSSLGRGRDPENNHSKLLPIFVFLRSYFSITIVVKHVADAAAW